jgi:glycerol kinase
LSTASHILALDQGTTSTRAIVFDSSSRPIASAQLPIDVTFPQPGWVEQDAVQIRERTVEVMRSAISGAGLTVTDIAAIGITNQRETTVLWDRATGRPLAPAIVWQSRQSAPVVQRWRNEGHEARVREITGLVLDPYFSASKIVWAMERDQSLRTAMEAGSIAFGTIDSWLVWNLTGGEHLIDVSNASRTMLFDIHGLAWSDELLETFRIPRSILPAVVPNSGELARTASEFGGIPIAGIAGDQHAALFGQACFDIGQAKNTYGTGSFLLMNAGEHAPASNHGLLTTIGSSFDDRTTYALEGAILVSGSAVQWLRDGLSIIESSEEIEPLARSVPDSGGVVFVPALTGLGAPDWDDRARGTIVGITRGTTRAHIARATLEAIAFQVGDVLRSMEADTGSPTAELRVDGGAARNDLLLQFQADISGVPVMRSAVQETTALGAAWLAGIGGGLWRGTEEVATLWTGDRTFEPDMSADQRDARVAIWRDAVTRSRGWVSGTA